MAEFDSVIPPGQTGKIRAVVRTRTFSGKLNESIVVRTNDPVRPEVTLYLRCVIRGVRVLPTPRAHFNAWVGEAQGQEFTIATVGGDSISVSVSPTNLKLPVTLERLANQSRPVDASEYWKQYSLTIMVPSDFPQGRFRDEVTLTTSSRFHPVVKIPVSGVVNPRIRVAPKVVRMKSRRKGAPLVGTIAVARMYSTGFSILRVTTDPEAMEVVVKEVSAWKKYVIMLVLDRKAAGDMTEGRVTIYTNDAFMPVIRVPVVVGE